VVWTIGFRNGALTGVPNSFLITRARWVELVLKSVASTLVKICTWRSEEMLARRKSNCKRLSEAAVFQLTHVR
jgi:hypothetical protein